MPRSMDTAATRSPDAKVGQFGVLSPSASGPRRMTEWHWTEAGAPYNRSHALVEESVSSVTFLNQDLTDIGWPEGPNESSPGMPRNEASLGYPCKTISRLKGGLSHDLLSPPYRRGDPILTITQGTARASRIPGLYSIGLSGLGVRCSMFDVRPGI